MVEIYEKCLLVFLWILLKSSNETEIPIILNNDDGTAFLKLFQKLSGNVHCHWKI